MLGPLNAYETFGKKLVTGSDFLKRKVHIYLQNTHKLHMRYKSTGWKTITKEHKLNSITEAPHYMGLNGPQ